MFVFFMFIPLFASASTKWYKWNEDKISIELKDYLNISEMKWPITLLRYKVDIANARVSDPKSFELIDETGKSISYQLTDLEIAAVSTLVGFRDLHGKVDGRLWTYGKDG